MARNLGKPPGPLSPFCFGFGSNPLAFLHQLWMDHGEVASFRCGFGRYVLLNRADLIEEVLGSYANNFGESRFARRVRRVLGVSEMRFGDAGSPRGLESAYRAFNRLRWPGSTLWTRRVPLRPEEWAAEALKSGIASAWRLAGARLDHDPAHVFAEAVRLYPPIWLMERRALRLCRLHTYEITPGTTILICPYVLHRNPRYFPEPARFNPERFASDPPPRFAYLPFGAAGNLEAGFHAGAEILAEMAASREPLPPDGRLEPSLVLRTVLPRI